MKFMVSSPENPEKSVGTMLQSVVLDGNPPDEVILDLMDLVNDVCQQYDAECCP